MVAFNFSFVVNYAAYNNLIRANFSNLINYIQFQLSAALIPYCLAGNRNYLQQSYNCSQIYIQVFGMISFYHL